MPDRHPAFKVTAVRATPIRDVEPGHANAEPAGQPVDA